MGEGSIRFIKVKDINRHKAKPGIVDDTTCSLMTDNPDVWWQINKMKNTENCSVWIEHENAMKNTQEIEDWIIETFDYPVICVSGFFTTEKTKINKKVITVRRFFSPNTQTEVNNTIKVKEHRLIWKFVFKNIEDATAFALAWRGEES